MLAAPLYWFALNDTTIMLSLVYPLVLSMRSIEGELWNPNGFISIPSTGQMVGITMSSLVRLNSKFLFFALCLACFSKILTIFRLHDLAGSALASVFFCGFCVVFFFIVGKFVEVYFDLGMAVIHSCIDSFKWSLSISV